MVRSVEAPAEGRSMIWFGDGNEAELNSVVERDEDAGKIRFSCKPSRELIFEKIHNPENMPRGVDEQSVMVELDISQYDVLKDGHQFKTAMVLCDVFGKPTPATKRYNRLLLENDSLRQTVKTQKIVIARLKNEIERYLEDPSSVEGHVLRKNVKLLKSYGLKVDIDKGDEGGDSFGKK